MAHVPFIPSIAGVTVAAAAVVIGAPLFSAGLRALRLRRGLKRVRTARLDEAPEGFVQVRGRVALESPLFAPISGQRCAGFRLEASGVDFPVARSIEDVRPFRLVDGGHVARVGATSARWEMPKTGERIIDPEEPLTERLLGLLSEMPEAAWLRQSGRRIRLVERALLSGAMCHVTGQAARTRQPAYREEIEYARTGTDDQPIAIGTLVAETGDAPSMWIGPAADGDFLLVSGDALDLIALRPPARNLAGIVAGPLLGLLGLLYLAAAADFWRALRAF
jgi:hypothetical protein